MKILELCHFSSGICGVWQRVKQESELLAKKGYEVRVFSSNAVKGSNEITSAEDLTGRVKIKRFSFKKIGGESFMFWNFEKEALKFKPDIIFAHSYRHPHTTKALKIAKKLKKQGINCKVFLVTHAPFGRKRSLIQSAIVYLYDQIIGRMTLKRFDKVITITNWEKVYLKELGLKEEKIKYIPNGIPEEFFHTKNIQKEENKILFLGRVSPIKDLETLIKSLTLINNKTITLEIVGPTEEEYKTKLDLLIKDLNIGKQIIFANPIYDIKEKINKIDSCKIFVLPSISEGMPQALIEAMCREKVIIASNNLGTKDLIEDGKNGHLFKIGDENNLAEKINFVLNSDNTKPIKEVKGSVKKFNWNKIILEIINLLK